MKIFIFGIAAAALLAGCKPDEGTRCNPLLFEDECASGLACTVPPNCVVAFCCPTARASSNANCQPCLAADGGMTD